ncbi:MAG: hypothetical protein U9M90_00005 [Patescibacteria group bacterium]|nr:hypothetical protein [Patescibacteria group bacterium]
MLGIEGSLCVEVFTIIKIRFILREGIFRLLPLDAGSAQDDKEENKTSNIYLLILQHSGQINSDLIFWLDINIVFCYINMMLINLHIKPKKRGYRTMEKKFFIVTENHMKLLKAAHVSWMDCEFGAPGIDPKCPYGNSTIILEDIAEIIGIKLFEDADGEKHLDKKQRELCERLHREMEDVLQILLSNCSIEVGEYESEEYGHTWLKVNH